jgi:hypothetical protein
MDMEINEQNDFFESEPVKQLLAESHAAGYIFLRYNSIEFKDEDVSDDLYRADDKYFVEYWYVQRACQFIDDVVNDRFDLHTLDDLQFNLLYTHFVEKHQYNTLLSKIKSYYNDSMMSRTFYVLPEYFTFRPKACYYLSEMTSDEAYTKLFDVIEIAKTIALLSKTDAQEVFQGKIKQVADEREKIKELSK